MRWWDGRNWTGHITPPAPPVNAPTDGFAIASLILGIVGGVVLAPIFGFIARSRIKNSGGARSGIGLANAGIWLSVAWVVLIGGIVAVGAASGALDNSNANDYHGEKRLIAAKIDTFEHSIGREQGAQICGRLFTEGYAATFNYGSQTCESVWGEPLKPGHHEGHIDVRTITITGDRATVIATNGPLNEQYSFSLEDGTWRIDDLVTHR